MKKLYPIAVEADVKQAIGARGHAGESYNKVLRRLLNLEEKKESMPGRIETPDQTPTKTSSEGDFNG